MMNCDEDKALIQNNVDEIINSELFKILSEPIRVKIIRFLVLNGPSDVGTVAKAFPQDRSVISRHLTMLMKFGILEVEKQSRYNVYSFNGLSFLRKMENVVETLRDVLMNSCPEWQEELQKK